ncbi:hypothetical protein [Hydrogenophaga sp. 2FB]|uniref:hypothetical protein n=1 Tax=Hydrogenophaga sp. 2FB TaxID=2502187 RepID=UPI0010F7BA93|nr:hypothetical protein [Hydrogenophaga sp. 2FB]
MSAAFPTTPVDRNCFHPQRYWTDAPEFLAQIDAQDAEMDLEDSLSGRYAFVLGVDLGRHRLISHDPFTAAEMARGFEHGMTQPSRASDRYLRKLLGLKRSAFERGIAVSSGLSADYLREVDVPVCPVSGVVLTHSTKEDTDWSIDRLDNSLGYVPGNLCVVSTRVNKLKGRAEFGVLVQQAQHILARDGEGGLYNVTESGLLVIEALRLASLMAAPSAFAQGKMASYAPFAMAPTAWSTFEGVVAGIHLKCARTITEGAGYRQRHNLFKRLGAAHWRASNRLVHMAREALSRGTHPCDIWFDGQALGLLMQLVQGLHENPPTFDGVDTDALVASLKSVIEPLGKYAR